MRLTYTTVARPSTWLCFSRSYDCWDPTLAGGNQPRKCNYSRPAPATDGAGNQSQVSFTVTVADTTAPVLSQRANVTAEATGASGAFVAFTLPGATDDVDPAPTVTASPASGTMFALGATPVTVTAIDASGNHSQVNFTVTVADTTAPMLSQPSDMIVNAPDINSVAVNFSLPAAIDNADLAPDVSATPASGSIFPLG